LANYLPGLRNNKFFFRKNFHTRQSRIGEVVEHGLDDMNEGRLSQAGDMPAGAGERES
jgi:hypothetical protein